MNTIELRIPFGKGTTLTVTAQAFGQVAVHRAIELDYGVPSEKDYYNVTHILSGMCVANYELETDAILYAQKLPDLIDLDAYAHDCVNSGRLSRKWKNAINKARAAREFGSHLIIGESRSNKEIRMLLRQVLDSADQEL